MAQHLNYWLYLSNANIPSKLALFLHNNGVDNLDTLLDISNEKLAFYGLSQKNITNLANHTKLKQLEQTALNWLASNKKHYILTPTDPLYPPQLKEIADQPIVLYVVGDPELLAKQQIAIVGSRQMTPTGKKDAFAFAKQLKDKGFVITSGLAKGVDTYAHMGALAADGKTIAVLGTGIDRIYPASNRELFTSIAEKGALVSEYSLGTDPYAYNFPRRNRIISGLSLGVLVVEAGLKSGSLITARLAGEQNKEVFAVPGSIHSPQSTGCHYLIKQGAALIENIDDILQELPAIDFCLTSPESPATKPKNPQLEKLTKAQANLIKYLDYNPAAIDIIVQRSGLSVAEILGVLLELELFGLVVCDNNGYYLNHSND